MNRPIKFRGRTFNGEWVHGNVVKTAYGTYIIPQNIYADKMPQYAVESKTVGQFTGLHDRNGKEIYEGDILKCTDDADEFITNGVVEWLHDFWNISKIEDSLYLFKREGYVEIIGNIFEHPELLG